MNVAILGSGNIGIDVFMKIQRSSLLNCTLVVGRNLDSKGMRIAKLHGANISVSSTDVLFQFSKNYDLVFDATSAEAHQKHASILRKLKKTVIDLTPSKIGEMCIPILNVENILEKQNINMVTCGGQASAPIAFALGKVHSNIEYIEVVSSIAAESAGPATRINIDEYLNATEAAIKTFSGCVHSKAILNINPAVPCVHMKTTIFAKINNPNLFKIQASVQEMVRSIQTYVPGYQLIAGPLLEGGRIVVIVGVMGRGDYLPKYAGNLDIITAAAIYAAESIAEHRLSQRHAVAI